MDSLQQPPSSPYAFRMCLTRDKYSQLVTFIRLEQPGHRISLDILNFKFSTLANPPTSMPLAAKGTKLVDKFRLKRNRSEKNISRPRVPSGWGEMWLPHRQRWLPISPCRSLVRVKSLDAEEVETFSRSPSEFPAKVDIKFTRPSELCLEILFPPYVLHHNRCSTLTAGFNQCLLTQYYQPRWTTPQKKNHLTKEAPLQSF